MIRQNAAAKQWLFAATISLLMPYLANAGHLEEVLVVDRSNQTDSYIQIGHNATAATSADASSLMKKVPGGNRNFNGALSGQQQYRGMYGPRMNVLVDGARITPAGPNWMDPPLHYLPMVLTDEFKVYQGIAPVSAGMGIGGLVHATKKRSHFVDDGFKTMGDFAVKGHSVDEGYNVGGMFGVGSANYRGHVLFSRDDGDDTEFGDGTIDGTSYERDFYGVGGAARSGNHEFSFEYHHVDTDNSGTPSLPLDILFFDADFFDFQYRGTWGRMDVEAAVSRGVIDHGMDNFSLRPAPDFSALPLPPFVGDDRRRVDVDSDSTSVSLDVRYPVSVGAIAVGFDAHLADHNASVFDPDVAAFFIENFSDAEQNVFTGYAEWQGMLTEKLSLQAGIRYARVESRAGSVDAQPAQFADLNPALCTMGTMPPPPPCAVRALRNGFNASDRDRNDDNIDAVARFGYLLSETTALSLSVGRKTRSPTYIERYLWIPLEVNAGLGDGNNYVGDPNLDPEKSWEIEGGFDIRTDRYYLTPRGYYRSIDDFIQGTTVSATPANMPVLGVSGRANGDPTPLRFSNVDAEIYGFDTGFGARITDSIRLDGNMSYIRGKRRDIDDNLFRISPPNLRMTLTYQRLKWSIGLESVFVARATHIAQAIVNDPGNANNSNAETPGHITLNFAGSLQIPIGDTRLVAGVENLLDKHYIDHLSGFNRVIGSDVPIGQRLPGQGVNGFIALTTRW